MSLDELKEALQDEKLKGLTAREFVKAKQDGLEWLSPNWTPTKVTHITNRG